MSTCRSDRVFRWEAGVLTQRIDELAREEPLEIRVRGRPISITMRTPGNDDELAAGFLLTEGVIQSRQDVLKIQPCEANEFGNRIDVLLAPTVAVDLERLTRHVFAASSCGLCGKATIDSIQRRLGPIQGDSPVVTASTLARFPEIMRKAQIAFDKTGGLHAAALFDENGELLVLREDVGRHNTVDKIVGHALLKGWIPLGRHVLLVSGRTSFEILQKSLAAGIPMVAAVSAPSNLAVQFATESRQTLIGFLRGDRMNVYAGAQRVKFQ